MYWMKISHLIVFPEFRVIAKIVRHVFGTTATYVLKQCFGKEAGEIVHPKCEYLPVFLHAKLDRGLSFLQCCKGELTGCEEMQ